MAKYRKSDTEVVMDEVGTEPMIRERSILAQIIAWLGGVIELLLVIRLIFTLLGADKTNQFASFIYSTTAPIVAPFYGLFHTTINYGIARFDIETVIAMVVVALITTVIAGIFNIIGV